MFIKIYLYISIYEYLYIYVYAFNHFNVTVLKRCSFPSDLWDVNEKKNTERKLALDHDRSSGVLNNRRIKVAWHKKKLLQRARKFWK